MDTIYIVIFSLIGSTLILSEYSQDPEIKYFHDIQSSIIIDSPSIKLIDRSWVLSSFPSIQNDILWEQTSITLMKVQLSKDKVSQIQTEPISVEIKRNSQNFYLPVTLYLHSQRIPLIDTIDPYLSISDNLDTREYWSFTRYYPESQMIQSLVITGLQSTTLPSFFEINGALVSEKNPFRFYIGLS